MQGGCTRMRKALRWLLTLVVLIGTVGTASAATAAEPEAKGTGATADIKDQLLAIPGMSLIEEKPYTGYRFFVLNYTQPVDHRHPSNGHVPAAHHRAAQGRGAGRRSSTPAATTSPPTPRRSEPTQIVDGNQVSMEYRFFTPVPARRAGRLVQARPSGRPPATSTASSRR